MMQLAAYAARPDNGRGRRHEEPAAFPRTEYQRDRDRIIHATAFRRLKEKTQVFVAHEGDHYRTRLTHTLEVSQIARALARALGLDEDLAQRPQLRRRLERGAARAEIAVLLDKRMRRKSEIEADHIGFDCPDYFVVGYGMDVGHAFRELPFVGRVVE